MTASALRQREMHFENQGATTENRTVQWLILAAALLVIALRFLLPFAIGKDQGFLLEAAERFVAGLGLTTTRSSHVQDISEPALAEFMTWWPPLFPLLVAAGLKLGLSLTASLKALYGITTFTGWLGWAGIAARLMPGPIRLGRYSIPLHYVLAAVLPIFLTPRWNGTDIFLWAIVPWVFLLIAGARLEGRWLPALALAGALAGIAFGFRYASAFLMLSAVASIAVVSPSWKAALRRTIAFALPCAFFVGCFLGYVYWFSRAQKVMPSVVQIAEDEEASVGEVVGWQVDNLVVASQMLNASPVLQTLSSGSMALRRTAGLLTLGVIILLTVILVGRYRTAPPDTGRALAAIAALSMLALVCFLMIVQSGYFMGVPRYYLPMLFAGMLVWYAVADDRAMNSVLRGLAVAALLVPLAFYGRMLISGKRAATFATVLSFTASDDMWKGSLRDTLRRMENRIYTTRDRTRAVVAELHRKDPDAKFYVESYYGFYTYDRGRSTAETGTTLRGMAPRVFWPTAFTSRPLRVYWVVRSEDSLPFVPPDHRKLVYSDPGEDVAIFVSDLPAGYHFR